MNEREGGVQQKSGVRKHCIVETMERPSRVGLDEWSFTAASVAAV